MLTSKKNLKFGLAVCKLVDMIFLLKHVYQKLHICLGIRFRIANVLASPILVAVSLGFFQPAIAQTLAHRESRVELYADADSSVYVSAQVQDYGGPPFCENGFFTDTKIKGQGNKATVETNKNEKCPDPGKLRNLCLFINHDPSLVERDPTFGLIRRYKKIIFEAACVLPDDSKEVVSQKISQLWTDYPDKFVCKGGATFHLGVGGILEYAISIRFDPFIDDVIYWGLDLNQKREGKTVLDYLQERIRLNENTALKKPLEAYFQELRKAGAKLSSEL